MSDLEAVQDRGGADFHCLRDLVIGLYTDSRMEAAEHDFARRVLACALLNEIVGDDAEHEAQFVDVPAVLPENTRGFPRGRADTARA